MEPRTTAQLPVTSSVESLDVSLHGNKKDARKKGGRRLRACPVVALLALFVHMISSGCGIALSAVIVRFGLDMVSTGILNLVARILVFAASCMGPFYVFIHLVAAKEFYVKSLQNGKPQIFSNVSVAVAVLVMRLGLPVWIAAVVLSALVAVQKGFDEKLGFKGNVAWVQLGVASLALLSLIIVFIVTEAADRPFATSVFSKRSFIKGTDVVEDGDSVDFSVPEEQYLPAHSRSTTKTTIDKLEKTNSSSSMESSDLSAAPNNYDREVFTERQPQIPVPFRYGPPPAQEGYRAYQPQRQASIAYDRPRSQGMPQPLESVFAVEAIPADAQDSPRRNGSHLSWRPPTRDSQRKPSVSQTSSISHYPEEEPTLPISKVRRLSSSEPASQPPSVPLPPMPVRQMTDYTSPTSTAPPGFTQGRPATAADSEMTSSGSNTPEELTSAEPQADASAAQPSLAQLLSALSTRAAARRRNSLVVRQADITPSRRSIDITQNTSNTNSNMTAILFQQPQEDELVEIPRPSMTPRDLLSSSGEPLALRAHPLRRSNTESELIPMVYRRTEVPEDFESSEDFDDEQSEVLEMRRPSTAPRDVQPDADEPIAARGRALQRSNTDTPLLMTNFSRPRLPGAGGEDDVLSDAGISEANASRPSGSRRRNAGLRKSRSLSGLADRAAARNEARQLRDQQQQQQQQTPRPAPRFSPFPKLPDSDRKIKGLGQGSTKRRDERIAQWRQDVNTE